MKFSRRKRFFYIIQRVDEGKHGFNLFVIHLIRTGFGPLECLNQAGAIMMLLGMELWKCDEKDKITITRDPEKGEYTIKREATL